MIRNDDTKGKSLKAIRERERQEKEQALREQCQALAAERYGEEKLKEWSNKHKGLFFLPVLNDDDEIEKLAVLKPIDRNILSYASTKITDEGLYAFVEVAMQECWIEGDTEILDDDNYFLPAADAFNGILKSKKAALVKR